MNDASSVVHGVVGRQAEAPVRLLLPLADVGLARAVGDRPAEHGVAGGAQVLVQPLPQLRLHVGQRRVAGQVAQLERILGQVEELRVRER